MKETQFIELIVEEAGKRLDVYCSEQVPEIGRTFIQKLIKDGKVQVNGKKAKASYKVKNNDQINLEIEPPKEISAEPQDIPLDIVYEDSDLIVVNKPQGLVVHPAPGTPDGTLVNALLFHTKDLSGIGGELRPGIVHRIDKDTSGLLVVAKNDKAHHFLSSLLEKHDIEREYVALVKGLVENNSGTINMPIGRDPKDRKKRAVTNINSKEAITHFKVLKRYQDGYTLCKFNLETGRTHQIRVHMKEIGHPIVGDPVYGGDRGIPFETNGQLLHARKLGFIHPESGEKLLFEAEIPEHFQKVLDQLENNGE